MYGVNERGGDSTIKVTFKYAMTIDLDELSDEAKKSHNMACLLNVFNNLVKRALREKKYE